MGPRASTTKTVCSSSHDALHTPFRTSFTFSLPPTRLPLKAARRPGPASRSSHRREGSRSLEGPGPWSSRSMGLSSRRRAIASSLAHSRGFFILVHLLILVACSSRIKHHETSVHQAARPASGAGPRRQKAKTGRGCHTRSCFGRDQRAALHTASFAASPPLCAHSALPTSFCTLSCSRRSYLLLFNATNHHSFGHEGEAVFTSIRSLLPGLTLRTRSISLVDADFEQYPRMKQIGRAQAREFGSLA